MLKGTKRESRSTQNHSKTQTLTHTVSEWLQAFQFSLKMPVLDEEERNKNRGQYSHATKFVNE